MRQWLKIFCFVKEKEEKKIAAEISVMQPILRFLQLLCENHNRDLQVSDTSLCSVMLTMIKHY